MKCEIQYFEGPKANSEGVVKKYYESMRCSVFKQKYELRRYLRAYGYYLAVQKKEQKIVEQIQKYGTYHWLWDVWQNEVDGTTRNIIMGAYSILSNRTNVRDFTFYLRGQRGQPDFLVFDWEKNDFFFVEVKSRTDALRINQIEFIEELSKQGFKVIIAIVDTIGVDVH